jgi:predicted RNA-binding Zn ribbon-like protein
MKRPMSNQFQLVAGHVVLDFANTLDWRFDRKRVLDLLPNYERFLEFVRESEVITDAQAKRLRSRTDEDAATLALRRAIELRETLDALFRAVAVSKPPSRSLVGTFNRFLASARSHESIFWQQSGFVRSYGDLAKSPEAPLWPLIDAAGTLLVSPDRDNIRECSEPSCRWLFLDRSKNHSRRWCDMQICGNRTKLRRFYARKRGHA